MNAVRRSTITIADIRMDMVARLAGGAALFILVAAFAISFFAIKWVANEMGIEPKWLGWLFPLVIDLPSLIASALTVALHDRPFRVRFYAWSVLGLFIVLSWACNAVHALSIVAEGKNSFVVLLGQLTDNPPNEPWLIALVLVFAAIPPVGVVLGVHLWAYSLRHALSADRSIDGALVRSKTAPQPERSSLGQRLRSRFTRSKPVKTTEDKPAEKPGQKTTSAPAETTARTPESAPEAAPSELTARHAKPEDSGERKQRERAPERPAATERELEDWEIKARALFDDAVRAQAHLPLDEQTKPNAAAISNQVNPPVNAQNFRKRISAWWKEYQADPSIIAADTPAEIAVEERVAGSDHPEASETPEADMTVDETADTRNALRDELHLADPTDDTPIDAEPVEDRQVATVA